MANNYLLIVDSEEIYLLHQESSSIESSILCRLVFLIHDMAAI